MQTTESSVPPDPTNTKKKEKERGSRVGVNAETEKDFADGFFCSRSAVSSVGVLFCWTGSEERKQEKKKREPGYRYTGINVTRVIYRVYGAAFHGAACRESEQIVQLLPSFRSKRTNGVQRTTKRQSAHRRIHLRTRASPQSRYSESEMNEQTKQKFDGGGISRARWLHRTLFRSKTPTTYLYLEKCIPGCSFGYN